MKFHDENYEGVVLKFPHWFIKMNQDKMNSILNELKDYMDENEDEEFLSRLHPDIKKNYDEIKFMNKKHEVVQERKEREKVILEEFRKEETAKRNNLSVKWELMRESYNSYNYGFDFNGKKYRHKDITNKRTLKKEFINEVKEIWKNNYSPYFISTLMNMYPMLEIDLGNMNANNNNILFLFKFDAFPFYLDSFDNIAIKYERLCIRLRQGNTKSYILRRLFINEKDEYYYIFNNNEVNLTQQGYKLNFNKMYFEKLNYENI